MTNVETPPYSTRPKERPTMSDHIERTAEALVRAVDDSDEYAGNLSYDDAYTFVQALDAADRLVTPEHDAAVAAEWADHFEVCQGAVGPKPLTVESMIAALRGPRPFGCTAGVSDADA